MCLVLKTSSATSAIRYEINKWAKGSKVYLINDRLEDMPALYRAVDCYVSSAACEGWGEPLSEAMACGLPTIAGENGGNLEFMDYTNSFLVKTVGWKPIETNTMESVIKPWFMYKPVSVKSLREAMRYVFDNPTEAKKYGKKASDDMRKFSWVASASKLLKILESVTGVKL